MKVRSLVRAAVPVLTLSLVLGACGDDDEASTETEDSAELTDLCALATEIFEQDGFPTAAQLTEYTKLAPEEIAAAVAVVAPPIIAANDEPAAFFAAVADDDVEAAIAEIDAFEAENCDIDHDPALPVEATTIDPDATRVDVTASEYTFDFTKELTAGPTSFVLKNAGNEVHFMTFTRIADGHTVEEALAFEGDAEEAGLVEGGGSDSGLAATGGDDEEVATFDLEPGNWVMLCFVAGPDGTPHAFTGMATPFTVS